MRSPADADIAQIEVTPACHLACSNCTHFSPQFGPGKKWFMSEQNLRDAVKAMQGWYEPGRILGWIGGEPTLHPRFEELALLFAELWGDPKEFDNGKAPILDFAQYAEDRLWDRRGGRGLWSSPGPTYMKHFGVIQRVFAHQTLNDHFSEGIHKSLMITRQELGIPDHEWIPMRDACWVQNTWSPGIRRDKFYLCEVMGAIDDLVFDGAHGVPLEPGCWKRKPDEFIGPAGDQRNICELCCACVKNTPSQVANVERHQISPVWQKILESKGSPQVKKGTLDPYWVRSSTVDLLTDEINPLPIIDVREHTKDRYMPAPNLRVSPENKAMRPENLSLVVVCVGYGELLAQTLSNTFKQATDEDLYLGFDQIVVVTRQDDSDTVRLLDAVHDTCSSKCTVVYSDACYANDFAFNKGAMLNAGLAALTKPDWILFTDADILLAPETGKFIRKRSWDPWCLYGTERREDSSPWDINKEPNGFFQLWHKSAPPFKGKWPNVVCENFCSAGGVDSWFAQQFAPENTVCVPELAVKHIPHGAFAENWNGIAEKPGTWRQIGWVNKTGVVSFPWSKHLWDLTRNNLRFTSTRTGEFMLNSFSGWAETVDHWLAESDCHVHVACRE